MNIKVLINLPSMKLKRVLAIKNKIERLEAKLEKVVSDVLPGPVDKVVKTRRKMSAAARKKIAAAARARWARFHAAKGK